MERQQQPTTKPHQQRHGDHNAYDSSEFQPQQPHPATDVEEDLLRLRDQRLREYNQPVHIPPQSKSNFHAGDNDLLPLMERVRGFLDSDRKVMLILGDSGAGKSTFNRHLERQLWTDYNKNDPIPLHINLPAIHGSEQDMVTKQLKLHNFSRSSIQHLKQSHQFVLICDGYDESQLTTNLHTINLLNRPGQWSAKMIISCRTQYLGQDYRHRFAPQEGDHYSRPAHDLFQEALIAPFSDGQIEAYVRQYVPLEPRPWLIEDYMWMLTTIPSLMDLVKNPFLLSLSLDALPGIVRSNSDLSTTRISRAQFFNGSGHQWFGANEWRLHTIRPRPWTTDDDLHVPTIASHSMELVDHPCLMELSPKGLPIVTQDVQDLSTIRITRVQLYDAVIEQWLHANKRRLQRSNLSKEDHAILDQLLDADFILRGIDYSTKLASSIFEKQSGNPIVRYIHLNDEHSWKADFFHPDPKVRLLRDSSPLIRTGNVYRFIHRSVLEYFLSRAICGPTVHVDHDEFAPPSGSVSSSTLLPVVEGPLFQCDLISETSVIQFLAQRVQQIPEFKQRLLATIELSKSEPKSSKAAANAITIMVRAGVSFHGADLRGVRISGADLSGGQFDSVQLQGSDLRGVNFSRSWIRQVNFSDAEMENVQFGELPFLVEASAVYACAYSPDGGMLALALENGGISIYDTTTWAKSRTIEGHASAIYSISFSSDNQQLVSGGQDSTVRLWSSYNGEAFSVLVGHSRPVRCVATSPSDDQVASASNDCTVRLWNSRTREPSFVLRGHTRAVPNVTYSPSGDQLATGSEDGTIRLWNPNTGKAISVLDCPLGVVFCLAFSPNGRQLISCHLSSEMQLWNMETREAGTVLRGHTAGVISAAFSPDGQRIASSSDDFSVRLWDAFSGSLVSVLTSHNRDATDVVFSPNGLQVASGGGENTARLWEVNTSGTPLDLEGHTGLVSTVAYSSSGKHIISGSYDTTMRQWDASTGASRSTPLEFDSQIYTVAWSPGGTHLAVGGNSSTIRLWNCQTGTAGPELSGHTKTVIGLAYSPCGRWLGSASRDTTVRLWDLYDSTMEHILLDNFYHVHTVAFSPNGHHLAVGSLDVLALAYSPNGRHIAIGTANGAIQLWDGRSANPVVELRGHTKFVNSVAFSPSGQWIASGSRDKTVRLWHRLSIESESCNRWSCAFVIRSFLGSVESIAWSPVDPLEFVTGCKDHSVRVWRVMMGEEEASVSLVWGSNIGQLIAADADFENARGLDSTNRQLLVQRGDMDSHLSIEED
ncbi:hypothetical protein BGX23_011912 [Mortierella sp. AD031]|nr:hypothetical protein BGX23_011912 [Mortierella sp. AD031]